MNNCADAKANKVFGPDSRARAHIPARGEARGFLLKPR